MRSFVRLFDLYNFFSVFLPGLASLMGSYMLLPLEVSVTLGTAIVPVFVLAFVFGEALHSLAVFVEAVVCRWTPMMSHREQFANELTNPTMLNEDVVKQFRAECRKSLRIIDYSGDVADDTYKLFYPIIQSYIYADNRGRSRTYQAIYAFCRSMFILLVGMPVLLVAHQLAKHHTGFIDRPAKYRQFFPSFIEFAEAAIPLCIIGALLFAYGTYKYKRFFVQYLISDFVVLRKAAQESPANSLGSLSNSRSWNNDD